MSSSTQTSIRSLESQQQHWTPPFFWDNLSRQVLIPRALWEFDRRTSIYRPPIPHQLPSVRRKRNPRELKRFARFGGPSLAHLRGYHSAVCSNSEDRSRSASPENMRKTRTLDDAFEVHCIDKKIFINNTSVIPDNMEEISTRLASHRSHLEESGFTMEKFLQFRTCNLNSSTDATIISTVLPIITGNADANTNVTTANDLSFHNLEVLTDGSLATAMSSFCDGLLPAAIDHQIRKNLGKYIVPSVKTIGPCLPNFFLEGKRIDWQTAKRQACYCGALGARGVYKLRSYVNPATALDNNAYTVVATYNTEGTLKLFTIHPTQGQGDELAYYMALIGTFPLTDNLDSFLRGTRALRNARDWAMEQRRALADAANAKIRALLPAAA